MKNKLGIPNNIIDITTVPKLSCILNLSKSNPVIATATIVEKTTMLKSGMFFSGIISPSLFKNILSFTKVVLSKCLTRNGTPIMVAQNKNYIQYEKLFCLLSIFASISADEKPKLIPNQNTKFQNLSFVSHFGCFVFRLLDIAFCFVKSYIVTSSNYLKSYTYILANIWLITKKLVIIPGIIALALPNISIVGENHSTNSRISEIQSVNSWNIQPDHQSILAMIAKYEKKHLIPSGLLLAVIKTESSLNPFALNINGKSQYFECKEEAVKAINKAVSSGVTNIDIGLAQINYRWHGGKFDSIDSMISAEPNISYAAEYLSNLKLTHGDWHKALRHYHSAKLLYHKEYSRKVG